jgi:hypothetical protein
MIIQYEPTIHSQSITDQVRDFNVYYGEFHTVQVMQGPTETRRIRVKDASDNEVFRAVGDTQAKAFMTVYQIGFGHGRR